MVDKRLLGAGLLLTLAASSAAGAQELSEGDVAPAFNLAGSDGQTHRLADYEGRAVVLAWFPRAFTGG